jgi:Domain of unknown function (DUF4288)
VTPIPHRNRSPHGWWIATYFLRAAWDDEVVPTDESTHTVWENTIILTAPDRDAAHEKALSLARADEASFDDADNPARAGRWRFEGMRSLLPIHDRLEDGAEILWEEHQDLALSQLKRWIRSKAELEAFDDAPRPGNDIPA